MLSKCYIVIGCSECVKEKKVVVFDLDGVLVDDSERIKAILKDMGLNQIPEDRQLRKRFWELYFSDKYMDLDRPIPKGISLAKHLSKEAPLVIITYRVYETQYTKTIEQLRSWGIDFTLISFRISGCRIKPSEYKITVIKDLGLDVYKAFDDSEEICETYKRNGIDAVCVKHNSL